MNNSELMPCPFCGSTPQLLEPQSSASQGPDERNMFELWALSQIYATTEVLAGLRTTSGYWDETATGAEANRLWKLWSSIRGAAPSPTSESKGVEGA